MHVYARFYTYGTLGDLHTSTLMNIARAGKEHRTLFEALRSFDQKPSWIEGRTEVDLRQVALVIAGGRNSIARYLLLDGGRIPLIHASKPKVGTYRETRLLKKNKTCLFVTGRGDLPPPQHVGEQVDYEPLTPHLREGYTDWNGSDVTCVFNPRQLSGALCHLWGLDINKILNDKYID